MVFVHLADRNTGGLGNFGDSVRLLEAVDFISRTADPQPCVINISAGRICGPKDGTSLVERAFDELLGARRGLVVVNTTGNYFQWRAHACGILKHGETVSLTFVIDPADVTTAVAISEVHGPATALSLVDALDLDSYHPFHATRAELLQRLGRTDEAAAAYARAADLAPTDAERNFLRRGGRAGPNVAGLNVSSSSPRAR